MLLFTKAFPSSVFFSPAFGCLNPCVFPSIVFVSNPRCAWNLHHMAVTDRGCLHLSSKGMFHGCSGFVKRCKGFASDGDFSLEAQILEFMKSSRNPEAFPSKKDLIEAGREDLVDAIVKEGGWLCLGWNLDEEEDGGIGHLYLQDWESILATDWDSFAGFNSVNNDERQRFSTPVSSLASSSLTGRSLETADEHESGIEGMLSRLEKERNAIFGAGKNDLHPETTAKETAVDLQGTTIGSPPSAKEGKWNNLGGFLSQNSSPLRVNGLEGSVSSEVQRTWSTFKTELQDRDFEGSEIALGEGKSSEVLNVLKSETQGSRGDPNNSNSGVEEMNHNQIQHHLQNLKSELSTVIGSLRSNAFVPEKGQSKSSDDLFALSDAFEFQENEILNTKDKLRSIRAKLAVVEGKMALTIIDAQKVIEEKQKRINCARRSLQFLRTTCVVWPNSAAEVLLVGSFDGWTTQNVLKCDGHFLVAQKFGFSVRTSMTLLARKMVKSSTGVFSLTLKLYPGKYEIKFIVDGQWKVDPLRPIVNSNGYENNLLIIT